MKMIARLLAIALLSLPTMANAQRLEPYLPGFRTIDGSQLNQMVDVVNTLSGNGINPLTTTGIVGSDSSLGIAGQAATTVTATGGVVAIVGGIGGATSGAGGAVTIAAGATTTSGAGANVTVTAGAGAAGTNAGGSINLVPGAAVSTGIPGTIKVNGDSNLICASIMPAAATDAVFFVATRALLVTSISQVHSVAAGGTSVLQVTKDTSTNAPGAGTDLLSAGFNLNATANTVQVGSLIATVATKTLAAGDRLAVDFADAIQSSVGIVVTACMAPL